MWGHRRRRLTAERRRASPPAAAPTAATREACIEALVSALVAGRLRDDEFELRWDLALTAATGPALACLLDDLGGPA